MVFACIESIHFLLVVADRMVTSCAPLETKRNSSWQPCVLSFLPAAARASAFPVLDHWRGLGLSIAMLAARNRLREARLMSQSPLGRTMCLFGFWRPERGLE